MRNTNKKVFGGIVGGFGIGNAVVYYPTGDIFSAALAGVIGVVMVFVAFVWREKEKKEDV